MATGCMRAAGFFLAYQTHIHSMRKMGGAAYSVADQTHRLSAMKTLFRVLTQACEECLR